MVNRLMHFVSIVLHVVNNYKVKQSNKKPLVQVVLVYAPIFQQLSLMLKAVCNSLTNKQNKIRKNLSMGLSLNF